MRNKSKYTKIVILILIFFTLLMDLYVYADENLEEKFKLLEECRINYEKELIRDSGTWRGKKYTYAYGYLSGKMDANGKICYDNFHGNSGVDYNNYSKMQDYVQKYTEEYFNEYLKSQKEDKLKGYFFSNQFIYTREYEYEEYNDIEARVTIFFVPENKNCKWCENAQKAYTKIYHEDRKEFIEIEGYTTSVYVRFVWENDKYIIKFIDNKPEGYDEYVARMKEHGIDVENIDYPSLINAEVNVKQEIVEAEKKEFDAKQIAIKSLRSIIVISFGSIIVLIILINLLINRKNKLKK